MGTSTPTLCCRWPSSPSLGLVYASSSSPPPSSCARVSCPGPQPQLSLSPVDKTLSKIKNSGVIACLRASSAEVALEAAHAAIAGGISVLEVVMSTPGVLEVLQQLVKEHPTMALGVGTVLRVEDAKTAMSAGAKFLMSPGIVKGIMDYVRCGESLYIPGAMTPTEILTAYEAGAKIVKVYPVSALGGIQYISALKKPFTQIPLVASQGLTIDSMEEYIVQGASSVVLSDAIFDKEAIAQYDFEKIFKLARCAALLGNKAVKRAFNIEIHHEQSFKTGATHIAPATQGISFTIVLLFEPTPVFIIEHKLNGSNYQQWSYSVLVYVKGKGKQAISQEEATTPPKRERERILLHT